MHKVDDVAFLRALIDKLVKDGLADPPRIYLVGVSNGGMMAYRMAAEAPELFKAVAVVSAVLDVPPENVKAAMPVLHIHGSDDPFIPFLGGIGKQEVSQLPRLSVARSIEAFVKADGASAPDGHDIPDTAGDGTTIRQYTYASKSGRRPWCSMKSRAVAMPGQAAWCPSSMAASRHRTWMPRAPSSASSMPMVAAARTTGGRQSPARRATPLPRRLQHRPPAPTAARACRTCTHAPRHEGTGPG
jgi:pimeloyl-ACP methyl ester carboxylesterase